MLDFNNIFYFAIMLTKMSRPVYGGGDTKSPLTNHLDSHSDYNITQSNHNMNMNFTKQAMYRNWPVLGLSAFSLFGIFGNMLVLLTIRRDHTLQTSVNYYLFSLAIADFAVCLIVIPFSLIQDFTGKIF